MIEESINNLTDEIRELKEVLAQLVTAYVKFELTDWSDVDVVHLDKVEQTEVATKEVDSEQTEVDTRRNSPEPATRKDSPEPATRKDSPEPATVKKSPKPATVKKMSDDQALAIVSGDEVVEEVDLPSIDDMYAAVITHIRDHSEVTDTIKEWVSARGAKTLRKVDESYRQECYDFLTALGVSL